MVGGDGIPVGVDPVEHRKVHDPDVAVRSLADRPSPELQAELAQHSAGQSMLVGDH